MEHKLITSQRKMCLAVSQSAKHWREYLVSIPDFLEISAIWETLFPLKCCKNSPYGAYCSDRIITDSVTRHYVYTEKGSECQGKTAEIMCIGNMSSQLHWLLLIFFLKTHQD